VFFPPSEGWGERDAGRDVSRDGCRGRERHGHRDEMLGRVKIESHMTKVDDSFNLSFNLNLLFLI